MRELLRVRTALLALVASFGLWAAALPGVAAADVQHVVAPGETLTSVAADDGLSIAAVAAANDISPNSELIAGQILLIPALTRYTAAPAKAPANRAITPTATKAPVSVTTTKAPVNVTTTKVATAVTTTTVAATPTAGEASGSPEPTPDHVSAQEIADIADADGVPAALAEGIAWQESGWDNDVVSKVGAVGVMQIVPATWTWINSYLTPADPLEPASAAENIRAGVLLLHDLLALTGGSDTLAVASYYQGLASVRKYGLYPETQRYVDNVLALAARFGG